METCKSLIKDTETWHKSIIWNIENIYPELRKKKKDHTTKINEDNRSACRKRDRDDKPHSTVQNNHL